jgi:DNA-binding transcriptional LysR family regulator
MAGIAKRNGGMETDLLRTFSAVARTGSFTLAARELGYVQSTVTGHVQALERRLGVRLLDRLSSGVITTDAGERLLPLATHLLDLQARITQEVPGRPQHPSGRVRLYAPETLCAYRLPALVATLRAAAPDVRLSLTPAGTVPALHALRTTAAEAVLLLEPTLSAGDLCLEALGPEELVLLRAPGPDPGPTPVAWAELVADDTLLLEDGCSYSDDMARRLHAGGQPESRRTRFGSIEAVKRCVGAGLGWTVLLAVSAAADLQAATLHQLVGPLLPVPTVYLATDPDRTLSAATRLTLEQLRALWAPVP